MTLSKTSISYLLVSFVTLLTHARLIPFQTIPQAPLIIDARSNNELPIVPIDQMDMPYSKAQNRGGPHPNTTVCYPVIGCFDNNSPYDNAGLEVPQSPEFINTQFIIFRQEAPTEPQFLGYDVNDQAIQELSLNSSRWLRIVVHGFVNNHNSYWIAPLRDELLKLADNELSDVIVVDWGNGAKFPYYTNAAANTRVVGKQLGLFLKKLQTFKGVSLDKVHCIGHSLGAHICGLASDTLDQQLARISGLDPAGPLFQGKNSAVRLDSTDGKFVDIIHSNTDVAFGVGLGSSESSGHVDFYVNGGQSQPGCPTVFSAFGSLFSGQSEDAFEGASCSHSRSHGYYIESINTPCPYTGFPCTDYTSFLRGKCLSCSSTGCGRMGFHSIESTGRGNLYLTTRDASPFCGYQYAIELELDREMIKTGGEIFVAIYSNYEMLTNVSVTAKSNANIEPGDTFRQVFSFLTNLGQIDYAIVHFNKAQGFLGIGAPKGNFIVVSRLHVQSLEGPIVYSGLCESKMKIPAYRSETILLNRSECGK